MGAGDYLQTYTAEELERFAQQQLKDLEKLRHFSIPVDIEAIVENLGIEIEVKRGLKEGHHIWGMIAVDLDTTGLIIFVDDKLLDLDHLRKIYRMTVAEEFAHSLLHGNAIKEIKTVEDFKALQNHSDWHKHDRNAKRLAAALLMPVECVLADSRDLYKQMVEIADYGDPESIKKYMANVLAEKYDVSVYAMKIRLSEWPIKVTDKIDRAMKDGLNFLD